MKIQSFHSLATDLYFMGGDDNSNYKSKLLNNLQIIYNQETSDDNWINTNYTFSAQYFIDLVDKKSANSQINNSFSTVVDQSILQRRTLAQNLIILQFDCLIKNFNGRMAGINIKIRRTQIHYLKTKLKEQTQYSVDIPKTYLKQSIIEIIHYWMLIVEIHPFHMFEPVAYLIRYKKIFQENNQQASNYMEQESNYIQNKKTSYSKIQFVASFNKATSKIQIAFPYMLRAKQKHNNYEILGNRHIRLAKADSYMVQVKDQFCRICQKKQNIIRQN